MNACLFCPEGFFITGGKGNLKLFAIFFLIAFVFAPAKHADACMIVTAANGKNILVGNNEDWKDPNSKI